MDIIISLYDKFNELIKWKKKSYKVELKIPIFNKSFRKETLIDCLKKLNSTSDPLVFENGEIMPYNNRYLTNQIVCYIVVWSSDIDKGCNSRGLGFYYGSGYVMTAKHVLENNQCHENDNIYILFPTSENILIYKAQKIFPENPNLLKNYDIAFIGLQGCLDPFENIKVEIGTLPVNDELHFYVLESGYLFPKYCKIETPNTNMKNQMLPEEFIISKAGRAGDSGTPIFSSSGTCVGLYTGVFKSNNPLKPLEYGKALQLDIILNASHDLVLPSISYNLHH